MNPNVHMLDRRASQPEIQRPSRAKVEAAVLTIIRWTGEDPDRDGLIETPARVDIRFESHCEHHIAPIIGRAWVAYIPDGPRGRHFQVDPGSRRFCQTPSDSREVTAQIANTINDVLKPQGVGVIIKATHHYMTTRGEHKPGTDLVTSRML
jgi:GTP cyclohydrolase IA